MKKVGLFIATAVMLVLFAFSASAAEEGYYTYSVTDGKATITDVNTSISGEVSIPSALGGYSVTSIGNNAFVSCKSLTSITIPASVTSIGSSAFSGCSSLTSITIPDSVTSIGDWAFYGCKSLTSITIPDSVTSIGDNAFYGCSSIIVNTGNANYSSDSRGVLFNKDKSELICYPAGNTRDSYTIPDSVTSIGSGAFKYCSSLTSITIPDSVTSIGEDAFYYCKSLTSITIGDGVTSIGYRAFFNCESLTSVTIGDSVTSIGSGAFYNCTSLTSITIPDIVTSIGDYAFYNTKYYNNESNWKDNILYIGNHLIKATSSRTSCDIREGTVTIASSAFYNCTSLTSITIPDSVTSIGKDAFYNCTSLTSITLPFIGSTQDGTSDTYFGYIFGTDSYLDFDKYVPASLKEVVITAPCKSIGDYAFCDCSSLTSITIPDSVTSIGNGAFAGCDSLTSITIPDSVTSIGAAAFYYCDSLTSITIPDSVTSIGSRAFYYCWSLTSVTIGNSVTRIGESAFEFCPIKDVYYIGSRSQWEAIAIEDGNSYLTNATIHYCTHKNIVDIPQQNPTCTKIGYTAGKQCSDCEEWISGHEEISKLGHSYSSSYTTDKKATLSANGSKSRHCTRDGCTAKTSVTAIARVSSVTLSKTNYIYDGKNKTPKVTVKDSSGKVLTKNVDYKLSVASKRSGIGKYTVKVTFMGNYSGSKSVYFYIKTGKPATVKSASQTTSSVKLTWSAVPGAAGYTVYRYSPSKKAYVKAGTTKGTSYTVKSLYAGTKYTFRVVSYGKTSGGKVYDSDSYTLLKTATKTKTPILSDVTAYKGKAKLFWTATSGETGYTVYYSTKKDSGFKKYANYESNTGYVNNLTSGKTYYFKVRTYIKTNSGYVYSDWSNIKGIKVK